jgi:UDP-glucose 4-epimerase
MRALVTGGAGFIGSHVVERYLAESWQVTVVDDLSSGRRENVDAGADLVVADISQPGLGDVLAGVDFDLVSHHAAQIDVRVSVAEPSKDARINLIGLLNVLEVVRGRGGRPVVFASSGGVLYGEAEVTPTPETAPKQPFSPYGVAKLASEYYLQYYGLVHGLRYAALRYGNVYGPRQNPEGEAGVVSIFCGKVLRGEPLTVFGTGLQDRDFVYVEDVAQANWLASRALLEGAPLAGAGDGVDGPAFNVGTSRPTTVLDLVRGLSDLVGRELEVRRGDARPGELLHSTLDASKAARRLGWSARAPLASGLERTYRHFESLSGASA